MTTNNESQFWKDQKGNLIHIDNIREIDKMRTQIVMETVVKAKELHEHMKTTKSAIFDTILSFIDISIEEYDIKVGGKKGNTTLTTFDGKHRVQYAIAEHIQFDERIQAAKALVDECLRDWTQDSRTELKTFVSQAFDVDKEGNLSTTKILGLRRIKVEDERWATAMQAISDSIKIVSTKPYVRVYERGADGKYNQIVLDFAAIQGDGMRKIPSVIPRGVFKKGSKDFNAIRSGYVDARRKDLEKVAREHITLKVKEIREEIHSISVSDHNMILFDKNGKAIATLQ